MSCSRIFILSLVLLVWSISSYALPKQLEDIVAEVAHIAAAAESVPVVVADLDETTVDSTARRFYSVREALKGLCGVGREGDCGRAFGINIEEYLQLQNRYDQNPLFDRIGIGPTAWRELLMKKAIDTYLSGRYMELDQAVPGAAEFVQMLRHVGAKMFFVSSRYIDSQLSGTIASLLDLGLMEDGGRAEVILRPRGMDSIEFKKQAFGRVAEWARQNHGIVPLVMENEPENMNAMSSVFPQARAVFVDGAYLKAGALIGNPIRVRNFR